MNISFRTDKNDTEINTERRDIKPFFQIGVNYCRNPFWGLGIIGIFLPILPTTPFLLLAAACYARSSKRFYNWLTTNKWFGTYIKNYQDGKNVSVKIKILSIFFLWLTILFSIFYYVKIFIVQIILIIIANAVTIHIVLLKTLSKLKEK